MNRPLSSRQEKKQTRQATWRSEPPGGSFPFCCGFPVPDHHFCLAYGASFCYNEKKLLRG